MEVSQQEIFWQERRYDMSDRRQRATRTLHHYSITGRRALLRRKDDLGLMNTDRFDKPVWFAALAIIVFSVLDFILTTIILESGGIELNLLMNHVIYQGSVAFFSAKYGLTVLAVLILLAHHQHDFFRTIKVKTILYMLALGYFCLFVYEILIITSI